jgi:hypothetical protein
VIRYRVDQSADWADYLKENKGFAERTVGAEPTVLVANIGPAIYFGAITEGDLCTEV